MRLTKRTVFAMFLGCAAFYAGCGDSSTDSTQTEEIPGQTDSTTTPPVIDSIPKTDSIPGTDSLPPSTDSIPAVEFTIPEEAAEITPAVTITPDTGKGLLLDDFEDKLDGLIYHTVKFCDQYHYEAAALKKLDSFHVPVLNLETDLTRQSSGQIKTRIEAFIEEISANKARPSDEAAASVETQPEAVKIIPAVHHAAPYVLGIDSGSTSTNAVVIDGSGQLVAWDIVRTGAKSILSAEKAMNQVLDKAKLKREDLSRIVSTGYGRDHLPFADADLTEITCHGKGAHAFDPAVRTILDIGGQDSKAIRLNEAGDVVDFVMNDKCAAGTGRFLEMMAHTLDVSLEELGQLSLRSKEDIRISSMCTVFAESEVISLIAENKEPEDIAHGVHVAIAGRAISLLRRVGIEEDVMMTGGVAKNPGMVAVLEEQLGLKLKIVEEPEIVGAYGAALSGLEQLK